METGGRLNVGRPSLPPASSPGPPSRGTATPSAVSGGGCSGTVPAPLQDHAICLLGKDTEARSLQREHVPLDPTPDWALPRRREGARTREARVNADLTQVQLGERIGRDHRTIHRWEYAQRKPNLEDLLGAAAAPARGWASTCRVTRAAP
nr:MULTISPECIES: helix-turn-helix transcriptional regulator [Streptomyces]